MNTNHETINIVFAGVGGQGILLASEIIARGAMTAGYMVKTNEVHGMAQRGGSVIAQIRYGSEVYSPLVAPGTAHVLGGLEKIEALRYAHYLAGGGLAVVSTQEMIPVTVSSGRAKYPDNTETLLRQSFPNLIYIDALSLAGELGDTRVANVILVGAISAGIDLPVESYYEAIKGAVKPKYVEINLRAFDRGRKFADEWKEKKDKKR